MKLATQQAFDVVDMEPVFKQHWQQKHERMDFLPEDGHWNKVAHQLAAEQTAKLLNKHGFQ